MTKKSRAMKPTGSKAYGKQLKQAREKVKMSVAHAAELVGVSRNGYLNYESGFSKIPRERYEKLCSVLPGAKAGEVLRALAVSERPSPKKTTSKTKKVKAKRKKAKKGPAPVVVGTYRVPKAGPGVKKAKPSGLITPEFFMSAMAVRDDKDGKSNVVRLLREAKKMGATFDDLVVILEL